MDTFLTCPHQCYLQYIEGWRSDKFSYALEFGDLFHTILEKVSEEKSPGNIIAEWKQKHLYQSYYSDQINEIATCMDVCLATFKKYQPYWAEQDKEVKWVAREHSFTVLSPIDGIRMRGKIDGVFDLGDSLWLFETKTKGAFNGLDIQTQLYRDSQTLFYSYAAERIYERPVQGILYNVIRRSLLKQRKDEPGSKFLERITEDIEKRPSHYFHRWRVKLNKDDLVRFRSNQLDTIIRKIQVWYEGFKGKDDPFRNPHHYINTSALNGRWGKSYLFDAICKNDYRGLKQVEEPHGELI
jgi:hypothetical protein